MKELENQLAKLEEDVPLAERATVRFDAFLPPTNDHHRDMMLHDDGITWLENRIDIDMEAFLQRSKQKLAPSNGLPNGMHLRSTRAKRLRT